jgi:hypothetical protein
MVMAASVYTVWISCVGDEMKRNGRHAARSSGKNSTAANWTIDRQSLFVIAYLSQIIPLALVKAHYLKIS